MFSKLDGGRPLYTLTVGEFAELLGQYLGEVVECNPKKLEKPADEGRFVYGLRGIQGLFNCSHKTAQHYKDHVIQEAVIQYGRKIVVDAEKALALFKERGGSGKCLWMMSRGQICSARVRRNYVLFALAITNAVAEPTPESEGAGETGTNHPESPDPDGTNASVPSLPSKPSVPSQGSFEAGKTSSSEIEPDGNDGSDGNDGNTMLLPPTFYSIVKSKLPRFLEDIASVNDSDADADMLILGSLAVVSACLPGVYGIYDAREIYPHLYLFVVARAASGKGRLSLCKALVEPIHEEMLALNAEAEKKYRADLAKSRKDKAAEPKVPPIRLLFLPANSSSTAIYQALSENDEQGLMFETEGDTLASAFGQDFGDFSDGLRKAFHHESISYMRRGQRETVYIKKPRLAAILSGTPNQIVNLMSGVENGLFSRFLFYYLDKKTVWKDVFSGNSGPSLDTRFYKLGQSFLKFNHALKKLPGIIIELTESQRKRFNDHFERLQADFEKLFGEETIPSVRRLGVCTFRISMILSVLRIMEDKNVKSPRFCRDDDFETAMSISTVLQQHMLLILKGLPSSTKQLAIGKAKDTLLLQIYWDALPEEFEAKEFKPIAEEVGLSIPTAERYVSQWVKSGRLVKIKRGRYKKVQY